VSQQRSWQHFTHEADIGVRGTGTTLAESFEQAACALTAVITDLETVNARQAVEISCGAPDPELLLIDWLNALVYEMAVQHLLFSRFDVQTDGQQLTATAWGERIDRDRHQPAVEVKGATLTELKVAQNAEGQWIAQCVVDV
jgi:SHS2 domain-containing protein